MSSWTTASYVQVITRLYDITVYLTILFFICCFLYRLIPLFNIVHRSCGGLCDVVQFGLSVHIKMAKLGTFNCKGFRDVVQFGLLVCIKIVVTQIDVVSEFTLT